MLDGAGPRGGVADRGGARLRVDRTAAGAAVAAFALYAATAARTVTFGDSGELIAASWRFGIAHPPGYPLYTAIAGAVLHAVPVGEPALRTNLLSGLFAALACGVVALWARSLVAAVIFATCGIVWASATETEVYALHALLSVLFLYAASRAREDDRWLLASAAALGLGLAHHPTIVLAIPAAAILAWGARPKAKTWALAAAVVVGIPVLLDATLLLRAARDPGAWGGLDSVSKVAAHVTANRYRLYDLGWAGVARGAGWSAVLGALATSVAWIGIVPALAGLVPRGRERWAYSILALAGIVFALRYATEDFASYLIPTAIAVAMLAGRAMPMLRSTRRAAAVSVLLCAVPLVVGYVLNDRSGDRGAMLYADDMLVTLPEGAVLFTDGDDAFVLAYATQVLKVRPDVTLIDRKQNLFESARIYAGPGGELGTIHAWVQGPARRPVFFMAWPGYELPEGWKFEPRGLFFRVEPPDAPAVDDAPLWSRYHDGEIAREARWHPGAFAASVAATYPLMRAEDAFSRGDVELATNLLDEAARRAPSNETVLNTIGTTWARRGDIARAAAFFERATVAKPQSVRAWLNLAQARSMLGDANGAAAAEARARALDEKTH